MVNEVSLVGSRCGDRQGWSMAERGDLVPPTSTRFGIDHFDEAIVPMSLECESAD